MSSKILCATDGSQSAHKAVDYAVSLARDSGSQLTFLTVAHIASVDRGHNVSWDSTVLEAADAQLQTELKSAIELAEKAGLHNVTCASAEGQNVAAAIIDFAEKHGYDHIVTGTVGRTGVARLLIGSVAQAVVAKAHCPVTVIR